MENNKIRLNKLYHGKASMKKPCKQTKVNSHGKHEISESFSWKKSANEHT